jgi:hypothetical protein
MAAGSVEETGMPFVGVIFSVDPWDHDGDFFTVAGAEPPRAGQFVSARYFEYNSSRGKIN